MIKSLGIKISILLVLLMLVSSTVAQADGGSSFRLLLEDVTTGNQRVITDQNTGTLLQKPNTDSNASIGEIQWAGVVGHFSITIDALSSEANLDGGGILTLNANVVYTGVSTDQFAVVLEDIYGGDSDGANATLQDTISGLAGAPTATLSTAGTLAVQSWLNPTGLVPMLGTDTKSGQVSPADNLGNSAAPGGIFANPGGILPTSGTTGIYNNSLPVNTLSGSAGVDGVMSPTGAALSQGGTCATGDCTSIYSESVVTFTNATSGGNASFTLTAAEVPTPAPTVPEPTTLLLLGSALLGLGVLPSPKKILNIHRSKAED